MNDMETILLNTAYFPPVQYMAKVKACDELLIEAHENYGKQSYRNRYDKDNSSSSYNYRYSRPSNSGSTYRPSGGSSGSYGTPSGGGGSYGGGSRGGGGRGR